MNTTLRRLTILSRYFILSMIILGANQVLPTSLKVFIMTEGGKPVASAMVRIFESKDAYIEGKEPLKLDQTNKKGKVWFSRLQPVPYYIEAYKGDMNNDGLTVITESLTANWVNKINIVIK